MINVRVSEIKDLERKVAALKVIVDTPLTVDAHTYSQAIDDYKASKDELVRLNAREYDEGHIV